MGTQSSFIPLTYQLTFPVQTILLRYHPSHIGQGTSWVHHPMSSGAGGGTGKGQASTLSTLSGRKTMSQTLNQPITDSMHPMPSSGAGGGTGRSWYSFHMSGFGMCGQCIKWCRWWLTPSNFHLFHLCQLAWILAQLKVFPCQRGTFPCSSRDQLSGVAEKLQGLCPTAYLQEPFRGKTRI
jgi:hypothetical protein